MRKEETIKLADDLVDVLEACGFSCSEIYKQDEVYYVELGQYTPAGEDWNEVVWFDGTDDDFKMAIRKIADNYDEENEAAIWIARRGEGGVPNSIEVLYEDAKWKKAALCDLAEKLEESDVEGDTVAEETMDREEFYDYIIDNFSISGEAARLISNILQFVENHYTDENEQYLALCNLLDGTIGLSDKEIRNVYM